jgi:hypothetical protein
MIFTGPNAIIHDVWDHIARARVLIAELTGKNPNVFYELAIVHTLEKNVILMAQSMDDIHFDLRHLRVIYYRTSPRGIKKLRTDLLGHLRTVLRSEART